MGNDKLELDIHTRLDARRTPGSYEGHGPDHDGGDTDSGQSKVDYGHREDVFRYSETRGFWKRSEFLSCNRGEPLRPIDERKFFSHPNWQRAYRAFNVDHPKCAI